MSLYRYKADVVRVRDGDTVWMDIDLGFDIWLRNQSVRLLGIDTPEPSGDTREAAIPPRNRLIELLESADNSCIISTVRITPAVIMPYRKIKERGKFGRILAELFIEGEERSLNQILLDEGLAVVYAKR